MAKKSMKEAATAGTSVFDQIANGSDVLRVNNANNVQKVQNAENAENAENVNNTMDAIDIIEVLNGAADNNGAADKKSGRPRKYDGEMVRLNLSIPKDIKEYLTIAAAKASIAQRRQISFTEYLCDLVAADRAQHNDE